MIDLKNVVKQFVLGDETILAVNHVTFHVDQGEFVAIVGPSGSGKSTLMHILGLLDVPDSGEYYLDGVNVSEANDNYLCEARNQKIGFIFQNFNLLEKYSAYENVSLPLLYNGKDKEYMEKRADELLEMVGLLERKYHLPNQLSGGQQQRVAIARALACDPEIILADEPTGALDSKTGKEIMHLLQKLNEQGQTIILITHDMNIAKGAKRIVRIYDGKLIEEDEYGKVQ